MKPAEDAGGRPAATRIDFVSDMKAQVLDELCAAHAVRELYKKATYHPYGINDKRLKLQDHSLGVWLLKFEGIIPSVFKDIYTFRNYYTRYRNGIELSKDDMTMFEERDQTPPNLWLEVRGRDCPHNIQHDKHCIAQEC